MHNSGKGSAYVRSRGGGKIIYYEQFKTPGRALRREAEVKKMDARGEINTGQKFYKRAGLKPAPTNLAYLLGCGVNRKYGFTAL
jgi:hypothetical protein